VGEGDGGRGHALRGRIHHDERVLAPRLRAARLAEAAPEVHDLLAADVRGAGGAELTATPEVELELALDLLEARRYGSA
jgi:Arc/MetJ family transcription regulator